MDKERVKESGPTIPHQQYSWGIEIPVAAYTHPPKSQQQETYSSNPFLSFMYRYTKTLKYGWMYRGKEKHISSGVHTARPGSLYQEIHSSLKSIRKTSNFLGTQCHRGNTWQLEFLDLFRLQRMKNNLCVLLHRNLFPFWRWSTLSSVISRRIQDLDSRPTYICARDKPNQTDGGYSNQLEYRLAGLNRENKPVCFRTVYLRYCLY
jgi:hypothetical protein